MNELSEVIDQEWIWNYEDNREKTRAKRREAVVQALQSLKPIIDDNREYLTYAQAKGWFKIESPQEEEETALHNALTEIIGEAIKWEIEQARKLAFAILQDVNDHEKASQVAKLLELRLKPYEVE